MKQQLTLLTIAVMLLATAAFSQKTWTGATSTAWNLAGNWSPVGIPTASDNVIIPSAPANQPLISGTSTPVCDNLTVNSGALLTIIATSVANAQLTVAGTATFNGGLSIGGHLSKSGKIVATNVVWNSTSTLATGLNARCEVSGNWTFSSGSSIDMGYCWVTFTGTGNSVLNSNSAGCKFGSLGLSKTSTATTSIGSSSVVLNINNGLQIDAGNTFTCGYNISAIIKGNINIDGLINFYQGTMSLEGTTATQSIQMATTGNNVNNLTINCSGTATLNNSLRILGNLTIQTGTFNPQNNTVYVTGNWINTAGPAYFTEGTGRVVFNVIINKGGGRDYDNIIQNSENFNILELNNAYGDLIINNGLVEVTCNQYDWTAGRINVSAGAFTAFDLADNGIFGKYTLSGTGTINLTNDGYVDLQGTTLNISGGIFNVYGGTTDSYWPYLQSASLTMSGGVLNFAETGIRVNAATAILTSNISGGTIKTAKNFGNYRSDFNPTGGTIEMYGPTDASLYCVGTAALYGLKINKTFSKDGDHRKITYPTFDRETGEVLKEETRAQIVNLTSPVALNGNFSLTSGIFNSNSYTIQAKRDWTNNAGAGSFNPGTGRVIFNGGNYHQYCFNETFNILEVAKASGGSFRLNSGSVNCAQYDWTIGSIDVLGGTFTANDLYENGIYGGFYVNPGGIINLYQDMYQYVDLNGSLTFTNGGTINVFGGNGASQWASGANASITMNAGTLDFKDQGITLTNLSPNSITENITGGTIRTSGGFFCNRADFTPVGGVLELYGSNNVSLEQSAGTLRDIKINKGPSGVVSVNTNITVVSIEVASGTLSAVNKIINQDGHMYVENGGTFSLGEGGQLKIAADMSVNVNSGGVFKATGTSANQATVTRSGSFYYYFNVNNGATIAAKYAKFQYSANIILSPNAIIDPSFPFDYCTFSHGQGTYIFINNSQELTIRGANFPTLPPTNTVAKTNNAGRITFRDATGTYAGPAYEYDPYNRIDWTVTQPGLWTGAVSANWHTAGNWDDGVVPTSAVNVTIPESALYMPVISDNAACNNLTLNGTLTINDPTLTVSGNAVIEGHLTMNYELSRFVVMGDLTWNSGSTASMNDIDTEIQVYGNFTFNTGSNVQLNNGGVRFRGSVDKSITNHSSNSWFYNLVSHKTSASAIDFAATSTQPLKVTGSLSTETGAKFKASSGLNIDLKNNLVSYGTFEIEWSRIVFSGTDQYIQPNVNDYLYNLDFNQSGTVTISTVNSNVLNVRGSISISSGVFNAGSSTINVQNGWVNWIGSAAFVEENSRVVFDGSGISEIYSDETFNIIEINKGAGVILINSRQVVCNSFDFTSGMLKVANGGVFTANDLADDGIFADLELQSGATVNLYQDIYQRVDLGGNLWITDGSTMNVYGGNGWSQWPYGADAMLYMSDGTLDFKEQGINVNSMSPNTLILDITGGTIRTSGGFFCNRADFVPSAGTVEMYGDINAELSMSSGTLFNFRVNKTSGAIVSLTSNASIKGELSVDAGILKLMPGKTLTSLHSYVESGGTLSITEGAILRITTSRELVVQGGVIEILGSPSNNAVVTSDGKGQFNFVVKDGGIISARDAAFSNMIFGVFVWGNGLVDPDNAFTRCIFENGFSSLLRIENDQDVVIVDARFPVVSAPNNVSKYNDQGTITLINATGDFAGEPYEYDPYNRIHWVIPQPGLWTGKISTNWHTPGNWDDFKVPADTTDVIIPVGTPFVPLISTETARCHHLTINGQLVVQNQALQVGSDAEINGNLMMTNWDGSITVQGDVTWNEGSTAFINQNAFIRVFGNWTFKAGSSAQINNGSVLFAGTSPKSILVHSENSWFNNVEIEKTGNNFIYFDDSSTQPLNTNNLYVFIGAGFVSNGSQDIKVRGNVGSYGIMMIEGGSLILAGTDPIIAQNTGNYFHNLHFNQSGTATISTVNTDVLNVTKNIRIISGVFEAGACTIRLGGSWYNQLRSGSFDKGTSRVVFHGTQGQFCSTEQFNILEIDKLAEHLYLQNEDIITCNTYDWTNGGMWIAGNATFIASDLADDGIYGFIHLFDGYVELHQDASQTVDLRGHLMISGGEFKVFGGNDQSVWGTNANATLTVSNGILDFVDQGIKIQDVAPYSFTSTMSNGSIRTPKGFVAQSPGFNPTGGAVELYGPQNSMVFASDGSTFYHLIINKPSDFSTRATIGSSVVKGNFMISEGLAEIGFGQEIECWGNIEIADGGWMAANSSTFSMKNLSSIDVYPNGQLSMYGYEGAMSHVKTIVPGNQYTFNILAGGNLEAVFTIFENMSEQGINLLPGAVVNPNYSFTNCEFRHGASGASTLLTIDNNQDLIIENASFPLNTWSGQNNVRKNYNTGSVIFLDAVGAFAGSSFEDDPHNRIDWLAKEGWAEGYVADKETYCAEAYQKITVEYFTVEDGGTAHLIAGQSILFLPETHIKSGGYMHARIANVWGFCENLPSMMAATAMDIEPDQARSEIVRIREVNNNDQDLMAFPNPTTGRFTISQPETEGSENLDVEIFNLPGELLLQTRITSVQTRELDITSWKPGMYLVKVHKGTDLKIFKLLKH